MGIDAEMYVSTSKKYSEEELKELRWKLGQTFQPNNFSIYLDYQNEIWSHSLVSVNEIHQDGPEIYPNENEHFIQVNLSTRYYGRGYERGDFVLIYSVARWLETNIVDAKVFYGGDSSGVLHKSFSHKEREELMSYFLTNNRDYFSSRRSVFDSKKKHPNCPNSGCNYALVQNGGGNTFILYTCHCCGREVWTHDNGKIWKSSRNRSYSFERKEYDYICYDSANWIPNEDYVYKPSGLDKRMACLIFTTGNKLSDREIKVLRHKIGDAFFSGSFVINDYPGQALSHIIMPCEANITGIDNSVGKYQVNIDTAFYDIGYEKGDYSLIYSIIRWLEVNVSDSCVFYGYFDDQQIPHFRQISKFDREEDFDYFLRTGHEPEIIRKAENLSTNDCEPPKCPNKRCLGKMVADEVVSNMLIYKCWSCGTRVWKDGENWFAIDRSWQETLEATHIKKNDIWQEIIKGK